MGICHTPINSICEHGHVTCVRIAQCMHHEVESRGTAKEMAAMIASDEDTAIEPADVDDATIGKYL